MSEPLWIRKEECLAFHAMLIARFGGAIGIRDEDKLDAALHRPQQLFHCEKAPLIHLGAIYASGIVKSHPFLDGNKRTGLMACQLFLETNGYQFEAPEADTALQILALADDRLREAELVAWLAANCSKR